jgi:6-phosphofructo-2-kinase
MKSYVYSAIKAHIFRKANQTVQLLQSNMHLKLSGPDYKDRDPVTALQDFKKRVAMYEKKYVPLGEAEERQGFSYCQMIDVGRKFITHDINGFLSTQVVGYLQHFNLAGRQVWISRHGESLDNAAGKIGGDAELSPCGIKYAAALSKFIDYKRNTWNRQQLHPSSSTIDGALRLDTDVSAKKFHVWTSMMQRSVQTAQFFDSSCYEIENLRMLDELNAGMLEGFTEDEIKELHANEYEKQGMDKLRYRYPGARGEGYLDVTKRLQSVILEMERVTGHVLLIAGLAVSRILLAYCRGMRRQEIADLQIPLGKLYMLEPVSTACIITAKRT